MVGNPDFPTKLLVSMHRLGMLLRIYNRNQRESSYTSSLSAHQAAHSANAFLILGMRRIEIASLIFRLIAITEINFSVCHNKHNWNPGGQGPFLNTHL